MNNTTSEVCHSPNPNLWWTTTKHQPRKQLQGFFFDHRVTHIEHTDTYWDPTDMYRQSLARHEAAQNSWLLGTFEQTDTNTTNKRLNTPYNELISDHLIIWSDGTIEIHSSSRSFDENSGKKISNAEVYSPVDYWSFMNQNSTNTASMFEHSIYDIDEILKDEILNLDQSFTILLVQISHSLINTLQDETSHNAKLDHHLNLKKSITSFKSLGQNWDGDGAAEIPESAVKASLKFLELVNEFMRGTELASVAPSPDGEVVFYWNQSNGYAEVNFDSTGTVTLCWKVEDEEMQLIEECDKIFFEDDWIYKSVVWKKLCSFLSREF